MRLCTGHKILFLRCEYCCPYDKHITWISHQVDVTENHIYETITHKSLIDANKMEFKMRNCSVDKMLKHEKIFNKQIKQTCDSGIFRKIVGVY
jgi:hypothetical protein